MNYRKKFIVKPGSNVNLGAIDPDYTGDFDGKDGKGKAKKLLKANGERLSEQQVKLYAGGELAARTA